MQRFRPGERSRVPWRLYERVQGTERRRQPRIEPSLPVTVCGEVSGVLHDISRTGLCLLTDEALVEGQRVALDLIDDATGLRCAFRARVIWFRPGFPCRAGLEFEAMSPDRDAWLASRFVDWVAAAMEG